MVKATVSFHPNFPSVPSHLVVLQWLRALGGPCEGWSVRDVLVYWDMCMRLEVTSVWSHSPLAAQRNTPTAHRANSPDQGRATVLRHERSSAPAPNLWGLRRSEVWNYGLGGQSLEILQIITHAKLQEDDLILVCVPTKQHSHLPGMKFKNHLISL